MTINDFLNTIMHPSFLLHVNYSFSQEGEDMIIDNLLGDVQNGFYIDLGAHHPTRFSNTMKFYRKGWHGINIDATPGSMKKFSRLRPRDINVEAGISDKGGILEYYEFNDTALNTFDPEAASHCEKAGYEIKKKTKIETFCIMDLLGKYLSKEQFESVDLLDVDIEGFDDLIIETWDWKKCSPTLILIEKNYDDRGRIFENPILIREGYRLVATTGRTAIYQRKE